MEQLSNQQILDAGLIDWRKMAQGLYARYSVPDYATAAAFLTAVASPWPTLRRTTLSSEWDRASSTCRCALAKTGAG